MLIARTLWLIIVFLSAGYNLFLSVMLYRQRHVAPAGMPAWLSAAATCAALYIVFTVRFFEAAMARDIPHGLFHDTAAAMCAALAAIAVGHLIVLGRRAGQSTFSNALAGAAILAIAPAIVHPYEAGYTSALPSLCLTWFLSRRRLFDLTLNVQSAFALVVGVAAAAYLFLVRRVAGYIEDHAGAVAALVEILLLFWAGLLWLPVYGFVSRLVKRRTGEYAEFGKRMIEEGSRILDAAQRSAFFASRIERHFGFRSARIVNAADSPELATLTEGRDIFHREGAKHVLPLRTARQTTGFLLIDAAPPAHLDEREPALIGLAAQIAQSLDACRLVEEKIALERELARQENLADLGKAAATIAHEIKNPLSAIKTIAQVLREDPKLARDYERDLSFLVSESDRLDRSVRQLLGFARASPVLDQTVELTEMIVTTAAAIGRQAEASGVRIDPRIEAGLRVRNSNAELLQQIILNLLLNAIQAAPEGSVVSMRADCRGARVRIEIADRGPGIPPELRSKVFDPFFTTKQKGTGLGLSIVGKNVRMLSGSVTFDFPAEGGTVAFIELPEDRTA